MIQDISPHVMHNEMRFDEPRADDTVLAFRGRAILAADAPLAENATLRFPTVAECDQASHGKPLAFIYLFAIDDQRFYLASQPDETVEGASAWGLASDGSSASDLASEDASTRELASGSSPSRNLASSGQPLILAGNPESDGQPLALDGYSYVPLVNVRQSGPRHLSFAGMTGYQLYCWYRDNHYCGRCGTPMHPNDHERALDCGACGNRVYPKLAPAVIVAVVDGDRILLAHTAYGSYHFYALIAGFCEIGETAEQTVQREVMEETGLSVKNIRYYKTQPWGIASNLLIGYFCELDGSPEVSLNDGELSEAVWMRREDMDEILDDGYSLTREMMMCFKERRLGFL